MSNYDENDFCPSCYSYFSDDEPMCFCDCDAVFCNRCLPEHVEACNGSPTVSEQSSEPGHEPLPFYEGAAVRLWRRLRYRLARVLMRVACWVHPGPTGEFRIRTESGEEYDALGMGVPGE